MVGLWVGLILDNLLFALMHLNWRKFYSATLLILCSLIIKQFSGCNGKNSGSINIFNFDSGRRQH